MIAVRQDREFRENILSLFDDINEIWVMFDTLRTSRGTMRSLVDKLVERESDG